MEITRNDKGVPIKIQMRKPADMHQHLRQGSMLKLVAPMVEKRFAAGIVMPNITPPVVSHLQLLEYLDEIRDAGCENFKPLMTMYLTDSLEPKEVAKTLFVRDLVGVKYYPRGLTTNSDNGVQDPSSLWKKGEHPYEVLRVLAEQDGVLLLHAADGVTPNGQEVDPYEQEKTFFTFSLPHIIDAHPDLKISVEHLSTAYGASQMRHYGAERKLRIGCSITAHHLLLDRRDVFRKGFHPHMHWWPIIQSAEHKQELRKLASEDHPFVWLGSDSAPHPKKSKESNCCVGGVLMAHAGIELYVEAFEDMEALDNRFERFASINGLRFYGFEPSTEEIELVREEWTVEKPFFAAWEEPEFNSARSEEIVPFRLGEKVRWKLAE